MKFPRVSLYHILTVIILTSMLAGGAGVLLFTRLFFDEVIETAVDQKISLIRTIDDTTRHPFWGPRIASYGGLVESLFAGFGKTKDVLYLKSIDNATGRILYSTDVAEQRERFGEPELLALTGITVLDRLADDRRIKLIVYPSLSNFTYVLALNTEPIREAVAALTQGVLIIDALLILFTAAVIYAGFRNIVQPIASLEKSLEKIGEGNLDIELTEHPWQKETAELYDVFKKMLFDLKNIRAREQNINRLKSELLSLAAHQLRTPLTGIKWSLTSLLEGDAGPLSRQQRDMALGTYGSNERLIKLVSDLLDVTRIEEGRFGHAFQPGNIKAFLAPLLETARAIAGKRGLRLETRVTEEPLPDIKFDGQKLAMAVQNIIDNALNYTLTGGVTIELFRNEPWVVIRITDTGVGIPETEQERIFERFFRGSNVVRLNTTGTGLGLYVTKHIVEAHNGSISITSIEGKGTTVEIRLPAIPELFPQEGVVHGAFEEET